MEQATLPSACFLQIVQPSVHSRQFGLSSAKAAIAFGATGGGGMSALTGEMAAQSDSMSIMARNFMIADLLVHLGKAGRLQREMRPVLQSGVVARDDPRGVVGQRVAQRLDPGLLRLGEIRQNIGVNQRLVAGMANP